MSAKPKINEYEFDGHVKVTTSDNEVRVWVCTEGINVCRVKATGEVHLAEYTGIGKLTKGKMGLQVDITVTEEKKK
jgi:hypothetical protein